MNPKISDFGLARIVEEQTTEASTKKVVGTYGYMSPEYALEGVFSIKSDVFSLGVVILEIVTGRRNTGFYQSKKHLTFWSMHGITGKKKEHYICWIIHCSNHATRKKQ